MDQTQMLNPDYRKTLLVNKEFKRLFKVARRDVGGATGLSVFPKAAADAFA